MRSDRFDLALFRHALDDGTTHFRVGGRGATWTWS